MCSKSFLEVPVGVTNQSLGQLDKASCSVQEGVGTNKSPGRFPWEFTLGVKSAGGLSNLGGVTFTSCALELKLLLRTVRPEKIF